MKPDMDYEKIKSYFGEKFDAFGTTPRGVDWNSNDSQNMRFDQLIKVCPPSGELSINDYGCGYGALIDYLEARGFQLQYTGFDLVEAMVVKAREMHRDKPYCRFTSNEGELPVADYTVTSGIFNVRFDTPYESWTGYVTSVLHKIDAISRYGFSFNMLTKYSDADRMRPDLYYADPCFIFDYCKTHFSRNVALLHDYELYDFTILVRKETPPSQKRTNG